MEMAQPGCVWDKVATAWASDEEGKRDFLTFARDHVKHARIHRRKRAEEVKIKPEKKPSKELGRPETSIPYDRVRYHDTAERRQLCG